MTPWVIKLGGSLVKTSEIKPWLQLLAEQGGGKLVIVPGGGAFADCVRQQQQHLQLNDSTAHAMAILAMQQMTLVFQDLQPDLVIANSIEQIRYKLSNHHAVIWLPDNNWLNSMAIAANWDITSDSLSALLATKLAAERLILVKSIEVADDSTVEQWTELGVVDKAFGQFVNNGILNINLLYKSDINSMISLINDKI